MDKGLNEYEFPHNLSKSSFKIHIESVFSNFIFGKILFRDTDHIIPALLNHRNFNACETKASVTDYKIFSDRNHFVPGQPTCKEEADFIYKWINNNVKDDLALKEALLAV